MKFNSITLPFCLLLIFVFNEAASGLRDGRHDGKRTLHHCKKKKKHKKFKSMVVFGDSLSDIGNLHSVYASVGVPEKYSNGPLLAELLAEVFGIPLSYSGHLVNADPLGNNFAVGGATAMRKEGVEPDLSVPAQVDTYLSSNDGVADKHCLYLLVAGGNDILETTFYGVDEGDMIDLVSAAAKSLVDQVKRLIEVGAKEVLVLSAGDVGAAPALTLLPTVTYSQIATRLTKKYNQVLKEEIAVLEDETCIDIFQFDLFPGATDYASAAGQQTEEPCIISNKIEGVAGSTHGFPYKNCDVPDATGYFWWDEQHPTTAANEYVTGLVLKELQRAYSPKAFPKSEGNLQETV